MKIPIGIIIFLFACSAFAGAMSQIPVELLAVDNQGRTEFISAAIAAAGLTGDATVRYEDFRSIVLSGDEPGSDFRGAAFHYNVKLDSSTGGFRRFSCAQQRSVGSFDPRYTKPIQCILLK